jgi:hypothetical protein
MRAVWRSLYSSLVGGWAQWQREWIGRDAKSTFGPWAAWTQFDPRSGELTRWRSIAWHVQERIDREDSPHAVPLCYAVVTSYLRMMMASITDMLPERSILSQCADCLWLTEEGYTVLSEARRGTPVLEALLDDKETYDEVFMDGRYSAVVRQGDKLYPVSTGIPTYAELGRDGVSRWRVAEPWATGHRPDPKRGVALGLAHWNGGKLVKECNYPWQPQLPWAVLQDGTLREELLTPVTKGRVPHDD